MKSIFESINLLKEDWILPREAIHKGKTCPFQLACGFDDQPVSALSLEHFPFNLPAEVREFWLTTQSAFLFKDQKYSQWGVQLLKPSEAVSESRRQKTTRPGDFTETDLILGRFFGDSELVIVSCDLASRSFGSVIIALPIDKRETWQVIAKSFAEFLDKFTNAQGDKYWES